MIAGTHTPSILYS